MRAKRTRRGSCPAPSRLSFRGFLLQVRRVDGRDRDAAGAGERQGRGGLFVFHDLGHHAQRAKAEATKQSTLTSRRSGLPRGACHRARIRATRWLAMTASKRAKHSAVIAREAGRSSIPETLMIESKGRGVLDTPQEPVIGLAEGETRWRGMTTFVRRVSLFAEFTRSPPSVKRMPDFSRSRLRCI